MGDVMTRKDLRESLATLTVSELLQAKWREETILAEIRQEMLRRDARAVDEACNLKEHVTNV